jgi:hypothetical protein
VHTMLGSFWRTSSISTLPSPPSPCVKGLIARVVLLGGVGTFEWWDLVRSPKGTGACPWGALWNAGPFLHLFAFWPGGEFALPCVLTMIYCFDRSKATSPIDHRLEIPKL